mmetsp:Transcript_12204/g.32863  ORF Transcript_12204/g.32863 Transcript_12204/m.32863 type:complete len:116 (-) Transcript_12204:1-348(-)
MDLDQNEHQSDKSLSASRELAVSDLLASSSGGQAQSEGKNKAELRRDRVREAVRRCRARQKERSSLLEKELAEVRRERDLLLAEKQVLLGELQMAAKRRKLSTSVDRIKIHELIN